MAFIPRIPGLLRRGDQAAVAGLVVLGAAGVLVWLVVQGGTRRMGDAERPEPKTVRFQVDVNTADAVEWNQLPGVGDKLAGRIVEYRRDHGPFRSVEDLRRVSGIGAKTLDKFRPYLKPIGEDVTPER
jgi:comEA protein